MCSPLPRRPRQLGPQHLGHVDLDDDLPLEVAPGVEVEVLVGRASEAVVAHDPVGDEVARAGRDVVELHAPCRAARSDDHAQSRVGLDRAPFEVRFRVIAGSAMWKKRSRSTRPPRMRTYLTPFARGGSTTESNAEALERRRVQSMIVWSVFEMRSAWLRAASPRRRRCRRGSPSASCPTGRGGHRMSSRIRSTPPATPSCDRHSISRRVPAAAAKSRLVRGHADVVEESSRAVERLDVRERQAEAMSDRRAPGRPV